MGISRKRMAVTATILAGLAAGAAMMMTLGAGQAMAEPVVTVHSDPNCGCCSGHVEHMKASGFDVEHIKTDDMRSIKREHGITSNLASCHTSTVDGYVIEGHVPASDIRKLLETRPDVAGIAAPGMPSGSPGMENGRVDTYSVLSWKEISGPTEVFATHPE
ncbi:DUF411 domain-containing protein [Vreelandella rituensis]|uniref:DUF411 domain-containing protein n=1 Tax=Vreelandella rituensis TaxID=2282306 RepID=A0A368U9V7_9GAMM|nr:DUF411 domain-containing protein [Halomonas rituensis]RCV93900.1 DUF411 domain-containing protein [Halomonas rituensis]